MKTNSCSTLALLVAIVMSPSSTGFAFRGLAANVDRPEQHLSFLRPVQAAKPSATPRGFIPNLGQLPNPAVKFVLRDNGVSTYFTDREFVLCNGQTRTITRDGIETKVPVAPRWQLIGANAVEPIAGDKFGHTVSFFRGNDPAKWHPHVPAYRDLRYPEILSGVELRVASRASGFEYSFRVQAHAKPDLRSRYTGITALEKSLTGDLIVGTEKGHFTESRPVSYQVIDGNRREVESSFELASTNEYRIALGPYDERHELVIDPVLDWSTFLGGTYMERIREVEVDPAGNVIVAGDTLSTDFADTAVFSTGPGVTYNPSLNEWHEDVFIAKLSPDGTELVWLGYLAGANATTEILGFKGLAVDSIGDLYVGGVTWSPDFPRTVGAAHAGVSDAFVTKIKSDGSAILWSRLLGGTSDDWGWGIALDPQANVYFAGFTLSANFPTLNAFDTTLRGTRDAFVTKLDTAGTVLWLSYLGGSNEERAAAIVADANGDVYVFGDTQSSDFPVTSGAFDTTLGGNSDAFITKLASDGTGIIWSTFLGGSGAENDLMFGSFPTTTWYLNWSRGDIALDGAGNVLVGGQTYSGDFPVTPGAFRTTRTGTSDGYVAKFTPAGARLWATYLGGSGSGGATEEIVWGLAVNPWDEVFVVGRTDSSNFPVSPDAVQTTYQGGGQDGFLAKLSANGSTLLYSSYLGSSQADVALGIVYDSGNVFVSGWAIADNFPTTAGAYQTDNLSWPASTHGDGYVMRFLDGFIAHDGFESGNYSGGSGDWAGNGTATGDISILTSPGPHSGSRHVRLRNKTGYLRRAINIPAGTTTVQLGFWAQVNSFEGSDKAYVRVKNSTSSTFTPIFTFTPALSDSVYHYYEFDLTGFLPATHAATQLQVEFDAEMNATNDNWYLDDIRFTGTL